MELENEVVMVEPRDVRFAGKKRVMVNENGDAIEKGKRQRVEGLNEANKSRAFLFAIQLTVTICDFMKIPLLYLNEVCTSTMIYAMVYRINDYVRSNKNAPTSSKNIKRAANGYSIRLKGVDLKITSEDSIKAWDYARLLVYAEQVTPSQIFEEVSTIMALMNLFGQRSKELQIGPDCFLQTKSSGINYQYHNRSLGLHPAHRHLMSGLSWEVSMRSTLSPNTSALAQLVFLSVGVGEAKYTNKNKRNVIRALSFIECIDTIANFMQIHTPGDNKEIIERLGRIIQLHGDKHKRKASPPFNAIFAGLKCTLALSEDGRHVVTIGSPGTVGFSSKKSALTFANVREIEAPNGISQALFRQWYFHCFFGTQGEDFGILRFMTGQTTWYHRSEYKKDFFAAVKSREAGLVDKISNIKIIYYSKNITANQSTMLSDPGECYGTNSMFAGYRDAPYTESELSYVRNRGVMVHENVRSDAPSILNYLERLTEKLLERAEELKESSSNAVINRLGRTKWRKVEGAGFAENVDGAEIDDIPREVHLSFWKTDRD